MTLPVIRTTVRLLLVIVVVVVVIVVVVVVEVVVVVIVVIEVYTSSRPAGDPGSSISVTKSISRSR